MHSNRFARPRAQDFYRSRTFAYAGGGAGGQAGRRWPSSSLLLLLAALAAPFAACQSSPGTGSEANGRTIGGAAVDGGGNTEIGNNPILTTNANGPAPSADAIFSGPVPAPSCSTAGAANVAVVVTTGKGPNGFASPIPVSNALYSMGIDDRTRADYVPTLDAKFTAYLKALNPGFIRFPAGHNGQTYRWATTGDGYSIMTPTLVDQVMALVQATNSNAYFAVNIESGTLSDATSFITYANKTKNYNVKWWQIGNEPTLPGLFAEYTTGDVLNPNFNAYINKYLTYRQALQSVDPSIKTVGVEAYTGVDVGPSANGHGEADWLTPFMAQVGNQVDAVAFHYYPLYSGDGAGSGTNPNAATFPSVANLLKEDGGSWPPAGLAYPDSLLPYMRGKMQPVAPAAQVWIDEFAEDSGNNLAGRGFGDTFAGALWAADSMARYADQGVGAIFHFIFKAYQPESNIDFGYTLLDPNNDPRPEYYAIWLMSNHYGDRMVDTTTSAIATVSSHAAIRAQDGSLRVMLINKSSAAQTVRLSLADYKPVRAAQWNLAASAIQAPTATINGASLTATNVASGQTAIPSVAAQACADNVVTIPALSVNILLFTKQ